MEDDGVDVVDDEDKHRFDFILLSSLFPNSKILLVGLGVAEGRVRPPSNRRHRRR